MEVRDNPVPQIRLTVNGRAHTLEAERAETLLDVLRHRLRLTGAKYGCGEGQCGACAVLLEGRAVRACVTPALSADRQRVTTIEGLPAGEDLHPVQRAFLEKEAFQCGFCTPGMIVAAAALLERNPAPRAAAVREALNGHLCRCGTYPRIVEAVELAAQLRKAGQRHA
jgi:aerobic-type carbon monoxide dehydrogenase small subunit (CoxS/CutS family)